MRPIGTRFTTIVRPDPYSTASIYPGLTVWEVVGYCLAGRYSGDKTGEWLEEIVAVGCEEIIEDTLLESKTEI